MIRMFSLVLALAVPGPALAQEDSSVVRDAVARGEIRPLSDLLPRLAADYGGEVLDVELDNEDGVLIYEFEILTGDGRLIEVEMLAASGEVLEVEDEQDDEDATSDDGTDTDDD
ncbi:PepSY domain-containing protein [Rubellimicrobium arenae]|uniref:PepSY domain-containing protein n=1 Tax=Rubellimicrobium arenae TaxID=2817372 RepID=UPI001B30F5F5|nr:PepSY domain-containing protein [Rubellimicrobium arenae]